MADDAALEARFWKDLKSSPVVMLGLVGARDGHTQPMHAMFEGEAGPLYFFLAKDNGLLAALPESNRAIAAYVSKGHDMYAAIHGTLAQETDEATIDRLWGPQAEAWFQGGRNDPKVALLRLDTEKAHLWKDGSSIGAAIERLLGKDPQKSYKDNEATVAL